MKTQLLKCFALCFTFLSLSLNGAEDVSDKSTGVTFPPSVKIDQDGKSYNLQVTGVATRKKLIVSVYSVASYLQDGAYTAGGDKIAAIMQDDKAHQLTLKWVHEASVDKVQNGYKESFKGALTEAQQKELEKEITQYVGFFSKDVKKGDEHILRWLPGGIIDVTINGTKAGSITNKEFAKGLWSIWFGDNSVVNRDRLISLMN